MLQNRMIPLTKAPSTCSFCFCGGIPVSSSIFCFTSVKVAVKGMVTEINCPRHFQSSFSTFGTEIWKTTLAGSVLRKSSSGIRLSSGRAFFTGGPPISMPIVGLPCGIPPCGRIPIVTLPPGAIGRIPICIPLEKLYLKV